jgi:RNA recognition motif-containing protein
MQIYVSNLPLKITDEELKSMFEKFGTVKSAEIGLDKKTGASMGYGIVVMPVKSDVRDAIDALRGKEIEGKPLRVRVLKPGDAFHSEGHTTGDPLKGKGGFKGDGSYRGGGALRRGGQRGS